MPTRLLAVLFMIVATAPALAQQDRPNVLFIAVDDLRPELGAYGADHMVTPHIDRLAESGRTFSRHYVHVPTCGASRYALLSGQQPARGPSWGNGAFNLYDQGHAPPSLPQVFRENGYHTVQMGKVSHSPDGRNWGKESGNEQGDPSPELPDAWDELDTPVGEWGDAWTAFFGYAGGEGRERGQSPPTEGADVDDRGYPDGLIADGAVEKLHELSEGDGPFFLAVGFYKPHLPLNAPKAYWDLYDRAAIDISHVDPVARRGGEFFGNYGHNADDMADEDHIRRILHGYYAATSYTDAQVGKVLAALDELDLADDTIVVLWGDHGWHLGELGYWAKHTLHEFSLHGPLIVRTPEMEQPGEAAEAITRTVDIFPTLVELADLPTPGHLDGVSFTAALDDPDAAVADYALGFWNNGNGVSLRTDRYRLIRHGNDNFRLYDHQNDPGETTNIADDNPDLVERLNAELDEQLSRRKALPDRD